MRQKIRKVRIYKKTKKSRFLGSKWDNLKSELQECERDTSSTHHRQIWQTSGLLTRSQQREWNRERERERERKEGEKNAEERREKREKEKEKTLEQQLYGATETLKRREIRSF